MILPLSFTAPVPVEPPWSPASLSVQPVTWIDPQFMARTISDGSQVPSFTDRTGLAFASRSGHPILKHGYVNGKAAIEFNMATASRGYLSDSSVNVGLFQCYAVFKRQGAYSAPYPQLYVAHTNVNLPQTDGASGSYFWSGGDALYVHNRGLGSKSVRTSTSKPVDSTAWKLFATGYREATGSFGETQAGAIAGSDVEDAYTSAMRSNLSAPIMVGNSFDNGTNYRTSGWLAELLVFPDELPTDEHDQLVAWLSAKYGLPLPVPGYRTGGSAEWFEQNVTSRDGTAWESGDIGDNQNTWLETDFTGPGTLSFYWKVSSEGGYDFLEAFLDGNIQGTGIAGSVDWTQKTFSIPSGSHVVQWKYRKDGSSSSGTDCGWVDTIVFTPA